jgi:predicted nucleic acid-binding protein
MPGSFFDTNVLVYLASSDAVKADRADAVVAAGGVISVQVLNAGRHGLSVYDAMIAAAAVHAACETLWSEDMQHGMVLGTGCG